MPRTFSLKAQTGPTGLINHRSLQGSRHAQISHSVPLRTLRVLRGGKPQFWGSRTSTSLRQPTAVPRFEDVDITPTTHKDDVILQPELNLFLGFKDVNTRPMIDKDGTFR